ncbi:30S ribosomal protein S6 [Akkermansiaceae bacterium]|nr:30S ribosomal protein S6 [Akkermansiaceae bacterium]
MSRKYEGMIIIDTRGNEAKVQELVQDVSKLIEAEGAKIQTIEDLGRKQFAYNARKLEAGQYVNVIFDACPDTLEKVQDKLTLNETVYMQRYLRIA